MQFLSISAAKRLAGKSISKMTYFMSSGIQWVCHKNWTLTPWMLHFGTRSQCASVSGVAKYLNSLLLSYSVLAPATVLAVCPRLWRCASSFSQTQYSYHDDICRHDNSREVKKH